MYAKSTPVEGHIVVHHKYAQGPLVQALSQRKTALTVAGDLSFANVGCQGL